MKRGLAPEFKPGLCPEAPTLLTDWAFCYKDSRGRRGVRGGPGMTDTRDTILIVDDEESVRRTVRDWLEEARLGVDILTAPDAETALTLANDRPIDLAVLDWNL